MSQALHIFRKDLRRGWPLLLLWAAILAYCIAPIWSDPLDAEKLENVNGMQAALVALAGMVAAALTIQHDSLIGVREFWMTRPIRISSLMAAKAAFVVVFLVAPPILLQFGALLRYGLPRDRWTLQLLELGLPWAGLVAVACLLAAWTRGLPGFFVLLAGLFLSPSFGSSVVHLIRGARFSITFPSGLLPALGLLALGLLALQYRTRRRVLGALTAAALLPVAGLSLFRLDPYASLQRAFTPQLPTVQVELAPGPGRQTFAAERPGATAGRVMDLWFVGSPVGASSERAFEISRVDGEIDWDDGRSTPFYASGEWYLADGPLHRSGLELADESGPQTAWRALGVQGDEPFESLLGRSGTLHGKAEGAAWNLAEVKTLPLQSGAEYQHASSKVRILDVERAPGDLRIRLRSRELVDFRRTYPRLQIALVNRSRGETIPLYSRNGGGSLSWGGLLASPPFLVLAKEGVWSPQTGQGFDEPTGPASDPQWLAGAELLLTYYDFAGTVDVLVEARNLTVDSAESGSPSLYSSSRTPWF